jgi:hypothetical protein
LGSFRRDGGGAARAAPSSFCRQRWVGSGRIDPSELETIPEPKRSELVLGSFGEIVSLPWRAHRLPQNPQTTVGFVRRRVVHATLRNVHFLWFISPPATRPPTTYLFCLGSFGDAAGVWGAGRFGRGAGFVRGSSARARSRALPNGVARNWCQVRSGKPSRRLSVAGILPRFTQGPIGFVWQQALGSFPRPPLFTPARVRLRPAVGLVRRAGESEPERPG